MLITRSCPLLIRPFTGVLCELVKRRDLCVALQASQPATCHYQRCRGETDRRKQQLAFQC